jgi:hypothetical protein
MKYIILFTSLKGNDRSCSDRVHPEHIESKAKAYMVEYDGVKSVFINRMNFILSHKIFIFMFRGITSFSLKMGTGL